MVIGALAASLLVGCSSGVGERINRAYTLARHPTPRNVDRIEAMLHDGDRDVRATALVVMQTLDTTRANRMATVAIQDPDGLVRAAAVTIVAAHSDPAAASGLAKLAVDDPVWQVRARALEGLSGTDDPALQEAFARALSDPVRHVRRTAIRAGIEHPGLLPVERLSDLIVSDPDWENRVDAARALGAMKDAGVAAALETALADPNEFVRAAAAAARRGLPPELPPH